jgi:hypothetical protein
MWRVQFDLLELELRDDLGYIRTHSYGTIVPKGRKPAGSEGRDWSVARDLECDQPVFLLTPTYQG